MIFLLSKLVLFIPCFPQRGMTRRQLRTELRVILGMEVWSTCCCLRELVRELCSGSFERRASALHWRRVMGALSGPGRNCLREKHLVGRCSVGRRRSRRGSRLCSYWRHPFKLD